MRDIKYLVCHCTATAQNAKVSSILNYWKNVLKWKSPGYHFLIEKDGKLNNLQPISKATNGVKGYNAHSIHISYIGGEHKDDRTEAQKKTMMDVLIVLKSMFPNAIIQGHRDFPNVAKACPRFNAKIEYQDL